MQGSQCEARRGSKERGAHLVGKDTVLASRPKVRKPVETGDLEVLERSSDLDVSGLDGHLVEGGTSLGVVGALVREMRTAGAFEKRVDRLGSDGANGVVVLPS